MWATAECLSPEPAVLAAAPVCAVLRDKEGAADAFFERVAERARRAGLRLAGALQRDEPRPGRRRCDMVLTDLASGRRTPISWDRGDLAAGCRLDQGALTEAADLIERSIRAAPPDLVIVNKFGKAEAELRGGMRDAIAAALEAGVPVLTGVAPAYASALSAFAGEMCVIAGDEGDVSHWLASHLGSFDGRGA